MNKRIYWIGILLILIFTSCQSAPEAKPTPSAAFTLTPASTNTPPPTKTSPPKQTATPKPTAILKTRISTDDLSPGLYYVTSNMRGGELNIHQVDGDFSGIFLEYDNILYGVGVPNPQYTKILSVEIYEGNLVIFDLESNRRMLYRFPDSEPGEWFDNIYPIWSPDGEKIIVTYSLWDSDQIQLGLLRLSEPTIEEIDLGLKDIEFPAWSPNGELIAFQARNVSESDDTPFSIYVMDSGCLDMVSTCKEHIRPVFAGGGYSYTTPLWSADNQYLAFNCTVTATRKIGLCVGDYTNGNLITVAASDEYAGGAYWSPKRNELAYWWKNNTSEDFAYGLCLNNINTGKIKIITTAPETYGGLVWSPDGNWIKINAGGEGTILIRSDGSDIIYAGLFDFWIEIPED